MIALLLLGAQAQPFSLDALMAGLASVPYSHAHYREIKTLRTLTRPLEDDGTLEYQRGYGGRLEQRSASPTGQDMIVSGSTLTFNRPGAAGRTVDLDAHPDIAALVDAIRATLEGDLTQLRHSYQVTLAGSRPAWRLTLVPTTQNLKKFVTKIEIDGEDLHLRRVETIQSNGDNDLMVIGF